MIQINLQHCKAASATLYKQITGLDSDIVLIHEPWINGSKIPWVEVDPRAAQVTVHVPAL